jgi:hypothetical protein
MSALPFFDITHKFSTLTMLVMFTDELFVGFETICSTLTGLWYMQEDLIYPTLLILLECYAINICAADISWIVISLPQSSLKLIGTSYCSYH